MTERHTEKQFKRRIRALRKALKNGRLTKLKARYVAVIGTVPFASMPCGAVVTIDAARGAIAKLEKYIRTGRMVQPDAKKDPQPPKRPTVAMRHGNRR